MDGAKTAKAMNRVDSLLAHGHVYSSPTLKQEVHSHCTLLHPTLPRLRALEYHISVLDPP
jgi:hypothetical protein